MDLGAVDVGTTSTPPATVTVTNSGKATSGTLVVSATGTGILATGCTGTLAVGASCTISITARPVAAGAISGSVSVAEGTNAPKLISVSGIATVPGQFSLTPSSLDLGNVLVKGTATGTIVMTNTATTGLTGVVITVNGTGFALAATGTCTDSLAVGQTCNIVVGFTAAAAGPASGSVIVSQGGVTKRVPLTATVQAPAKLAMTPPSAALTAQLPAPSAAATFYVTNSGDVPSGIPTVALGGANAADFSIASNTCVTALAGDASASCQVAVVFSPKVAAAANEAATLTVTDSGAGASSVVATLSGTAVPPSTLALAGGPDLGTVVVGATGALVSFTLTNNGGSNSGTISVATSDPEFVLSSTADLCTGKDLPKAGTCTFALQFKPSAGAAGVVAARLTASGASTANPAVLTITGTAVPPAKLVASPTVLDFGSIPTSQESAPLTLTITNIGGAPSGALTVTNTGAQFKIKGDTCSATTLAALKTCTIIVTFTAVTVNVDAAGSITVTDGQTTASATLHGAGMAHPAVIMAPQQVCPQYTEDDPLCTPFLGGFSSHLANPSGGIRFLDKVVGATTSELTVTVYNETDPTFAVDSGTLAFTITGAAAADFAIVKNNCTAPLVSTASFLTSPTSCVLTITVTPSAVGLRNALLVLTTSRGGISQTTLEAKGLPVIEVQPLQLSKTHTGLDFGQVPLGDNDPNNVLPYRVWVRSTTSADHNTTVTVTLPTPTPADFVWPADAATFTITTGADDLLTPPVGLGSDPIGGGGVNLCTNKTLSLALGADGNPTAATESANLALGYVYDGNSGYWYCDFPVQFYPHSARGALSAALTATGSGGGTSALTLTGNATGPLVITPSPALLAEPVAVGMASATNLTLTISNKGAIPETGLSFALSGTGSGDFQIVGTTCWSTAPADSIIASNLYPSVLDQLQPGQSCLVWLGFQPTTQASYSVTFTATAANGAGTADDETATDTIQATGSKTFGALTVTPDPGVFANTAYKKTDATPVTFTVKNNGTLDTGPVTIGVVGFDPSDSTNTPVPNLNFEIVSPVGVAGACNITGVWTVAGSGSCTVQIRAKPTVDPKGVKTQLLNGTLQVAATPGGAVNVPLTYYETSNLMVDGVSSEAFTFDPAGASTVQTHNFVVSNLGSSPVSLAFTDAAPFTHDETVTGLTPAVCTTGTNTLAAGGQCTLVVKNSNNAGAGTIGPLTLTVQDSANSTNQATMLLSGTTLPASSLVTYGIDGNTSAAPIDLGTVPFGAGRGGDLTLWFQNGGGVATQPLTFRWDTGTANGVVNTLDPEFILTSLYPENPQACLSGTAGGGQQVPPKGFCTVTLHFTPNPADPTVLAERVRHLNVLDPSNAVPAVVYLQAAPAPSAGMYVQEISSSNNEGFFQFTQKTAPSAPGNTEVHTFQITNVLGTAPASGWPATWANAVSTTVPFTITTTPPTGFTALTTPCTGTALAAAGATCQFFVIFTPAALTLPVFPSTTFTFGVVGAGAPAPVTTTLGVMGRVQQAAKLQVMQAPTAPGCVPAVTGGCVDFGKVAIGGTKTQALTVVNMGDVALTAGQALVVAETAASPAGATFVDDAACAGKVLAAFGTTGDRCVTTITATGSALALSGSSAIFEVGSGGATTAPAATYGLKATVVNAALLTVTGTATFPTAAVTGYSERTFTITNAANAQTTGVVSVALGGAGASQFALVGTTCAPNIGLAAGANCQATVRFAPTALSPDGNAITATLNVTATPGSAAPLTILGMPKSALTIAPIDTGTDAAPKITMGTPIQVLTVTKDNTAVPTAALDTSITSGSFDLIDDQCYGKVLSGTGATCTITVKYIGLATSTAQTATLTVNGGSAGQTAGIVVSYTGAAATTH